MNNENFSGVFNFTNASDEDFTALWNNKEYKFPAGTTCPLIIPNETLENIQSIRKKFALKYAQREFFKTKDGKNIEKEGMKHLNPATYDESILEKYVQQCLVDLPIAQVEIKEAPKKVTKLNQGTAVFDDKGNIPMDRGIDGYEPPVLGKMSDN